MSESELIFSASFVMDNIRQGKIHESVDYMCQMFGHNKQLLRQWFDTESHLSPESKANVIIDIFVNYTREIPAIKQLFYAKMFEEVLEKHERPDIPDYCDVVLQDFYYKAIRLQGKKKLTAENVSKTINKLILEHIEKEKIMREEKRVRVCEALMSVVDDEKVDNPLMWKRSMEQLIEALGSNSVVVWKRRVYDLAERIAIEGFENAVTPNILDCFNETMQNYMDAMLQKKEGDVETLSKNIKVFFNLVKLAVSLCEVRKKCIRKRKHKKKSSSDSSDSQTDDEEEIVLNKKECMFCGTAISPLLCYEECQQCSQEGTTIQSKF